jgi:hypothetical protein
MDDRRTAETADDYSYDLAHEVPVAHGEPRRPHRRQPGPAAGSETRPEDSGDYSYDLAHEVPQREGPAPGS